MALSPTRVACVHCGWCEAVGKKVIQTTQYATIAGGTPLRKGA